MIVVLILLYIKEIYFTTFFVKSPHSYLMNDNLNFDKPIFIFFITK